MISVREAFYYQSKACADLGSPFMARLMSLCAERLNDHSVVGQTALSWREDPHPSASSLPLRLAGALHKLVLSGDGDLARVYPPQAATDDALWTAIETAFDNHSASILNSLENAPQTNEVRRSVAVVPALTMVATRFGHPMALYELGTSAGLNLRADQFQVFTPQGALGHAHSALKLTPEWTGPAPASASLDVRYRYGVDVAPIDPLDPEDQVRLLSYIWPDQPERLVWTRAAIDIAREVSAEVTAMDAGAWLKKKLAAPSPGIARVVFHTVAWQYFPEATVAAANIALEDAARRATQDSPLARISMEADDGKGAGLTLTTWPDGESHSLARVDFHGRWINWTGRTVLS